MTDSPRDPILRVVPQPSDINSNGHIFGGWVLSRMDQAGGIAGVERAKGRVVTIAIEAERNWALPDGKRKEIVPGASHFLAHDIASPSWRNAYQVATIGDHTFLKVQSLKPRAP